jgi:hypothetical protein
MELMRLIGIPVPLILEAALGYQGQSRWKENRCCTPCGAGE